MSMGFAPVAGCTGLVLFLASAAPGIVDTSVAAFQPRSAPAAAAELNPVNRTAKADRLPSSRLTPRPAVVIAVELVGVNGTSLILRDQRGAVVYHSDPLTGTTVVSKNADIPNVTLKDTAQYPLILRSQSAPEGPERRGGGAKRSVPTGCEAAVSPLVRNEARRVTSRCVT